LSLIGHALGGERVGLDQLKDGALAAVVKLLGSLLDREQPVRRECVVAGLLARLTRAGVAAVAPWAAQRLFGRGARPKWALTVLTNPLRRRRVLGAPSPWPGLDAFSG
jgi:hypothetical protein